MPNLIIIITLNFQIYIGQGIWLPFLSCSLAICDLNIEKAGIYMKNITELVIPRGTMLQSTITGSTSRRKKSNDTVDKIPPHYILAIRCKYFLM